MLPRTRRFRMTQREGAPCGEASYGIGYQAILCPVSAAEDMAGANGGDTDTLLSEIAVPPGIGDEHAGSLARAIGLPPAEAIFLHIGLRAPLVPIDFIRRHDESRLHMRGLPRCFQQVGRAHDVRG